jgi:hypothetical protein
LHCLSSTQICGIYEYHFFFSIQCVYPREPFFINSQQFQIQKRQLRIMLD